MTAVVKSSLFYLIYNVDLIAYKLEPYRVITVYWLNISNLVISFYSVNIISVQLIFSNILGPVVIKG